MDDVIQISNRVVAIAFETDRHADERMSNCFRRLIESDERLELVNMTEHRQGITHDSPSVTQEVAA